MNGTSDAALHEHWRSGDASAGNALVSRHVGALSRFFQHRAGQDADDLLQRTWLACIATQQRLRHEATFRTYLFTIARHELYRFFRQRAARAGQLPLDDEALHDSGDTSEGELIRRQRESALQDALAALPEADRELLHCYYATGLNSRMLAAQLGIEPSSVRARLHRSRAELKRLMSVSTLAARPAAQARLG